VDDSQDTEKNLRKGRGSHPNSWANLRPFSTGGDIRRNVSGRPRGFDEVRKLAQQISCEMVSDAHGETMSRIERIFRQWSESTDVMKQREFVAYAYGRPPDRLDATLEQPRTKLILHYGHEAPDYERPDHECLRFQSVWTTAGRCPEPTSASKRVRYSRYPLQCSTHA